MLSLRHLYLFWLLVGLPIASALNEAAPYEIVYLYNAYKAEFATQPDPSKRKIATACPHQPEPAPPNTPAGRVEAAFIQSTIDVGVVGICSFKDFVRHIGNTGWRRYRSERLDPVNPVSEFNTLEPDADRIASHLRTQQIVGGRLLIEPHILIRGFVATAPFSDVVKSAADVIQTARKDRAAGVGPAIVDTVCLPTLPRGNSLTSYSLRLRAARASCRLCSFDRICL